jgi:hypothetical protein
MAWPGHSNILTWQDSYAAMSLLYRDHEQLISAVGKVTAWHFHGKGELTAFFRVLGNLLLFLHFNGIEVPDLTSEHRSQGQFLAGKSQ